MMRFLARLLPLLIAVCCVPATAATGSGADVATTWRLLDYVAVDYAGAVKDHQVISDSEYAEMQEFAATAPQVRSPERTVTLPGTADDFYADPEAALPGLYREWLGS